MYTKFFKRFFDIALSLLALIVLSPILLIVAALVRITLGTPVIYAAERVGKNGKIFKLYKFRSMTDERDENGDLLPGKDRLTKLGRVLRATSLDELPELINIVKGDMSIIGPRPLPEIYLPYYTEEENMRHKVRPGLSGWAQANGRNSLSWSEKFALDVWYINHISMWLDIKIILLTVFKVFRREGIGQGEQTPVSLHIERGGQNISL